MQKEGDLNRRGAIAMGFDQQATEHQFTLADDGGWIEVSVKDPDDTKKPFCDSFPSQRNRGVFQAG